ncbi:unnamed protein product, partial [Arabidopsis halleri]
VNERKSHIGSWRNYQVIYKGLGPIHSLPIGFELEAHDKPEFDMVSEPPDRWATLWMLFPHMPTLQMFMPEREGGCY